MINYELACNDCEAYWICQSDSNTCERAISIMNPNANIEQLIEEYESNQPLVSDRSDE